MDAVRAKAHEFRPRVLVAGWSAYSRTLDFGAFRSIADEVGAHLWLDMAHFAGLVAAGLHPSPVPHADLVSTTVHKTLAADVAKAGVSVVTGGTDVHLVLVDLRRSQLEGRAAEGSAR